MFSKCQWDWSFVFNWIIMECIPLFLTVNTHAQRLITKECSLHLCFNGAGDVHNYLGTTLLKLFSVFLVVISIYHLSMNSSFENSSKSLNCELSFEKKLKNAMLEYILCNILNWCSKSLILGSFGQITELHAAACFIVQQLQEGDVYLCTFHPLASSPVLRNTWE